MLKTTFHLAWRNYTANFRYFFPATLLITFYVLISLSVFLTGFGFSLIPKQYIQIETSGFETLSPLFGLLLWLFIFLFPVLFLPYYKNFMASAMFAYRVRGGRASRKEISALAGYSLGKSMSSTLSAGAYLGGFFLLMMFLPVVVELIAPLITAIGFLLESLMTGTPFPPDQAAPLLLLAGIIFFIRFATRCTPFLPVFEIKGGFKAAGRSSRLMFGGGFLKNLLYAAVIDAIGFGSFFLAYFLLSTFVADRIADPALLDAWKSVRLAILGVVYSIVNPFTKCLALELYLRIWTPEKAKPA